MLRNLTNASTMGVTVPVKNNILYGMTRMVWCANVHVLAGMAEGKKTAEFSTFWSHSYIIIINSNTLY